MSDTNMALNTDVEIHCYDADDKDLGLTVITDYPRWYSMDYDERLIFLWNQWPSFGASQIKHFRWGYLSHMAPRRCG